MLSLMQRHALSMKTVSILQSPIRQYAKIYLDEQNIGRLGKQ